MKMALPNRTTTNRARVIMKTFTTIAMLLVAAWSSQVHAQASNPNKLPACPKADFSKPHDVGAGGRTGHWHNCWGRYTVELSKEHKGDFLDGEWRNGVLHGRGFYNVADGSKYAGEFESGNKHGQGTYTFSHGDKYVGEWKVDNFNGKGTYVFKSGEKYLGEFKDGKFHGQGIKTLPDGRRFEGIWDSNNFIREAKVNLPNFNTNTTSQTDRIASKLPPCPKPDYSKNDDMERLSHWNNCWGRYKVELHKDYRGDVLEGEWRNGSQNGQGSYTYANGDKYIGEFKDNTYNGQGTYTWATGDRYVGEYKDGKKHGFGTGFNADGASYVGEYRNDKFHGQGTYTFANGSRQVGEFKGDKLQGRAIKYKSDGSIEESGIFDNDILVKSQYIDPNSFTRLSRQSTPSASGTAQSDNEQLKFELEAERQRLAEERRRLDEEKRQREQARATQRINLQISHTQPNTEGSFFIDIKTNADTASLKIDGTEEGGRADGNYVIKRIARAGQVSSFRIVATDVFGNTDTRTITVSRALADSQTSYALLNPGQIKPQPARDAVAIIIGIADYKSLPKAEFANDDARVFYDYAIRALGIKPENIKLLVDNDAEEIEILRTFRNWLPSKVRSTTEVYVYYSGHGLPTADGQSLYLIPPRAAKDLIDDTAIPFSKINAALQATKPKSVTIFLDACYSGQARSGETLIASARPVTLKTETRLFPDSFTVITASQNDQISSSNPDLKHGIFSYYLMKGMEGEADMNKDGKITLGEIQSYLTDNVGRHAGMMNRKQEPQLVGDPNRVLVGR